VIHRLIHQGQKEASVSRWCRVLSVSRSGFYHARRQQQGAPKPCSESAALKAAYLASGGNYGSRRLMASLRAQGLCIGRYRVRRLMHWYGLRARWRRKFVHTTNSRHGLPVADNVLQRQFRPVAADRAWAGDITYVRTRAGWLYLATVMDLYSRKIVGWAMAPHLQADLVCQALSQAIEARRPQPGLLVHTDRGSQYASESHRALLARHGLVASMSRKGNCWDNAVMERFFLNLKMERVWQRDYANHAEAVRDISDYIVNFYNETRLHSTLGYRSPNQVERHAA
jgi:transposase InsO family protein